MYVLPPPFGKHRHKQTQKQTNKHTQTHTHTYLPVSFSLSPSPSLSLSLSFSISLSCSCSFHNLDVFLFIHHLLQEDGLLCLHTPVLLSTFFILNLFLALFLTCDSPLLSPSPNFSRTFSRPHRAQTPNRRKMKSEKSKKMTDPAEVQEELRNGMNRMDIAGGNIPLSE